MEKTVLVLNDATSRLASVIQKLPHGQIEREVCEVQQMLLEHLIDLIG